ncbi:MAG: DNA-binding protein [Candidatus Latescibacteria bacterium]|nr:DNA-binding protein [Candidatus Latescibacterota bacterium]
MKTAEQVKDEFRRKGVTISGWAKKHGFRPAAVQLVIDGKAKCYYGNAHKIAVLLGMKDGEIAEV